MIKIDNIKWEKKDLYSKLEFDINNVSHVIVNTLRRIILSSIPIYAFDNITITENTSVFNNNYMKLRIKNMPVIGIQADNPIFTPLIKNKIDIKNNIEDDIDINPKDDNVNSSSLKQLTMYLEYENNSTEIMTVGTDDCKFYYSEKQIKSPYNINIPIIKLQPKQKFKMSAITVLGIEHLSSIYSPVSIFTYKQLEETKFRIIMESRGQLNEKQILQFTYDNIKMMLDVFLKLIPNNTDISGKLVMMNGEHTIGNIISEGLQSHKLVKFGGYNAPHLLDTKIIFEYELIKEHDIKEIMTEIVEKYIDIFTQINKYIQKIEMK